MGASHPASTDAVPAPPRVLFARQAIVDRRGRLAGYELLFRGRRGDGGAIPDAEHATSQVLVAAFAEVGIAMATGGTTAFVNVSERFLHEVDPIPLPSDRTVLELLEDASPAPALVERLRSVRAQGFRVALDDFNPEGGASALVDHVDLVKVDLRMHDRATAERLIAGLSARGKSVVAEKVEDQAERNWALAAGADLFQGYFFCRPVELAGAELRASSLARLRCAAGLTAADAGFEVIEEAVRLDPSLTLRLLRYLNSAALALPHRISSIHHAIVMLGLRTVRQWALLLLLAGIGEQRGPLVSIALTRARTCELLAEVLGAEDPDAWFSVGLLSVVDALAGAPLAEVISELPLDDDVCAALVHHDGPKGAALAGAIACERGELPDGDPEGTLAAYGDAVGWADRHGAGL
ncbi:MAG: EAL domain-containing protein [Solirubrobacterales bacterium]|nr:EAL domain-containing protein [Solirubrobacterales bacterium]